MNVGVCRVELRIPESMSLKSKRHIVKSITSQLKNKFNVSVAEVGGNELWQSATLAICLVSNDRRYTDEVLSKAANFVASGRFDVEIMNHDIEIISL